MVDVQEPTYEKFVEDVETQVTRGRFVGSSIEILHFVANWKGNIGQMIIALCSEGL